MKKGLRYVLGILLSATVLFGFSSCIDDDWFDDDWWEEGGWNDDRRAEDALRGRWFVDYVEIKYGECPYYETDVFNFYSNGVVEISGDQDFYERGRWFIEDRYLYVDLDGDGRTDLSAYIDKLYRNLVTLDVKDRLEGSRYYLELGR